jgi:phospholipid transport system substrate-binding protein
MERTKIELVGGSMRKLTASKTAKGILRPRVAVAILFFLLANLLGASLSMAGAPTEQLRATIEKMLAIVSNSTLKSKAQQQERRSQLAQAIHPRFDFTEMAKRSLGSHWGDRTPEEQRDFVAIFAGLLGRSYVGNIESYSNQKIIYGREVNDTNYAEVNTSILAGKDKNVELSINYKLHLVNEDWKVYDIVVDNISLINNYRSQFHRVIVQSSFEDLVRRMKEKQSQVPKKPGESPTRSTLAHGWAAWLGDVLY